MKTIFTKSFLLSIGYVAGFMVALSSPTFASDDHDHDHGEFDFDHYDLVLEGVDLTGEECFLGLLPAVEGESEMLVETSFSHEGEGPGTLSLVYNSELSNFSGISDTGRIAIQLLEGSYSLADANSFAVMWDHEGHVDTGFCSNLVVVAE